MTIPHIKLWLAMLLALVLALLSQPGLWLQAQPPIDDPRPPILTVAPPVVLTTTAPRKLTPDLWRAWQSDPSAAQHIIIDIDAPPADLRAARRLTDEVSRRGAMVTTLQATARRSQVGVLAELNAATGRGQADVVQSLWIVNAVAARTSLTTALTLAQRDDVATIRLDEVITLPEQSAVQTTPPLTDSVAWGVARIQADRVWSGFYINGSGVVVANVDSGVDYYHPGLQSRYRGFRATTLPPNNAGNWIDVTGGGAQYPVDSNGHGTHTMGTIVGRDGVGVAPGATWIAVKAFSAEGYALESWLHQAFEWLLAPNGDPELAPDVVNNSWGNTNSSNPAYLKDMQLLLAAGIIPVFSAGNTGPAIGSIQAPGSYTMTLAVAASDADDDVAYFSSRGPSPWGQVKPQVAAPGVQILSTLPGGAYGTANGTSMAAPHVAGVLALLHQADRSLTYPQLTQILTGSTESLSKLHPNNDSGWGLVNAHRAVQHALNAAEITGLVSNPSGTPLANVQVDLFHLFQPLTTTAVSDADGRYRRGIVAGDYRLQATTFGYEPYQAAPLKLSAGQVLTHDITLTPLPTGQLSGMVRHIDGQPVEAVLRVEGTPLTTTATAGRYTFDLPAGRYTVTVRALGYRVAQLSDVPVGVGQTTVRDVTLTPIPTILLVDSGGYYYGSQSDFYTTALDALRYSYDIHRIKDLTTDVPDAAHLAGYDTVIWSSPSDSPGYVGAGDALSQFLAQGGHLLLSGQDVAYFDGGGEFFVAGYFFNELRSFFNNEYLVDTVQAEPAHLFAGLDLTIAGEGGANNQSAPDALTTLDEDLAQPVFRYPNGKIAGLMVDSCEPYFRAVNLPFGLEAVTSLTDRAEVLRRSIDWFVAPRNEANVVASPTDQTVVAEFGGLATHTISLRNLSQLTDGTDTYQLTFGAHQWAIDAPVTRLTVPPCQTGQISFSVQLPPGLPRNARDTVTITVQSTISPALKTVITRTSKSPAPVLVVNQARFYPYTDWWTAALAANGLPADVWSVHDNGGTFLPDADILARYPLVMWTTSYNWFDPFPPNAHDAVRQYLDNGGRFFLNSQLYLWENDVIDDFATDYLGVYTRTWTSETTRMQGVAAGRVGNGLGPYSLAVPNDGYQNYTHPVMPTGTTHIEFVNDDDNPLSLTAVGATTETWHTAFSSAGLEVMPRAADRAARMGGVAGWLSWLGQSTVTADTTIATGGDVATYTAVLLNDGPVTAPAIFTATFPPPLSLVAGSSNLGPGSEQAGEVRWQGTLPPQQPFTITYRAKFSQTTPYGTVSRQVSWFTLPEHYLTFNRQVLIPVNTPAWDAQLAVEPLQAALGQVFTYTFNVTNTGTTNAPAITVTAKIPSHLWLRPFTPTNGTGQFGGGDLLWQTAISRNQTSALTFTTRITDIPYPFAFSLTLTLNDAVNRWQWSAPATVSPHRLYLPLIFRQD